MAAWQRLLRYEFKISISVALILAITVAVIAVNLIWPHAPSWIGYPIGFTMATAESIWQRRTARARRSHARP